MQLRKGHRELSVIEAADNLSNMAELDLFLSKEEGAERNEEQIGDQLHALSWHDPAYYTYNQERIRETLQTLLKYMQEVYERDKGQLRDFEIQQGIQALMLLAGEAAQKIDKFTEIFKGESVTELKEFKELQHFYLTKIVQRFQTAIEPEEKWLEEWKAGVKTEAQPEILRDLETVRRDQSYELFLIRKEDGRPYFNQSLLRHLQLVGQFDSLLLDESQEAMFGRLHFIHDRDRHASAKEILQLASAHIDDYFKEALKFKQMGFVSTINKAVMALMMSANSRNLMQNTPGKSALHYYADFHYYLRHALTSAEYRRFIAHPPALTERFLHTLLNLSHLLCTSFFLRVGSRKEMIAWIHTAIERGGRDSVTEKQTSSPLALWNNLLDADHSIRHLLKQYPNGPLIKTLHLFRDSAELKGFNPIAQQNLPGQLYAFSNNELHTTCVRMPSPTQQEIILKAQIIDEFSSFIRTLSSERKNQRYLLINLQDRTAWQEHSRCLAIEGIQKDLELDHALMVVTLPKNTEFYLQSGPYLSLNEAQEFLRQFIEQIASGESCGFYFPNEIDQNEIMGFSKEAMKRIHHVFFADNEALTHKNRLDFIEIFYLLLTLKLIEMFKPDLFSFICKDAIDTSAAAHAELFAFLRAMSSPSQWSIEEKNFLLWMLYAPALSIRERAIDSMRLNRMLSALSIISAELDAHRENTIENCSKLYAIPFFKALAVKEI